MKVIVNDENILKLWKQGLSDVEIATELGISNITVGFHRRDLHLKPNRPKLGNKKRNFSKEFMEEICSKYRTDSQIANTLGITTVTVAAYRKKYNIPANNSKVNPIIPLTDIQKQVVFGTLLGDAYCKLTKVDCGACIVIQHSLKQKQYLNYKAAYLKNYSPTFYDYNRNDIRTGKVYGVSMVSFSSNISFNEFREMFYTNNKKHIPIEYLEKYYTPLAMAIHYMDDGSYAKDSKKGGKTLSIATCGFTRDDLEKFKDFLYKKYKLECTITKSNRVYIRVKSRSRFFNLIRPYICESMRYKIDVSELCESGNAFSEGYPYPSYIEMYRRNNDYQIPSFQVVLQKMNWQECRAYSYVYQY